MNLTQLKKDLLFARKNNDTLAKNLLSTLIGQIESDLKSGGADEDKLTESVIRKFIKSAKTLGTTEANEEIEILEAYLPQSASKEEVLEFLRDKDLSLGGRLIGEAKKHFNGNVDVDLVKQTIALLNITFNL